MKTYIIFATIAVISAIALMGIPQLTGTVFVNNRKEEKPLDWLSAQALKFREKSTETVQEIPQHIKAIKITGDLFHRPISVYQDSGQYIRYNDYRPDAVFTTVEDTLIISNKSNERPLPPMTIVTDNNVRTLIFDGLKRAKVYIYHNLPLEIAVKNRSEVTLKGNRNTQLDKMSIADRSTFNLALCFTPVIDMQIDNSMVYVDPLNHIDSLKTNLIGKSNIKTRKIVDSDAWTNALFKEFDKQPHVQIIDINDKN